MKRASLVTGAMVILGLGSQASADISADVPPREWLQQGGSILTLDVVPANARIEIDGDVRDRGPWLMTAGVHLVVITAPGRQGYRTVLRVLPGRRTSRHIELAPRPVTGRLDVRTTPLHTRLIVDGQLVGDTPRVVQLLAGRHRLQVTAIGYRSARRVVRVPRSATLTVRMSLTAERRRFRRPRWVASLSRDAIAHALGGL